MELNIGASKSSSQAQVEGVRKRNKGMNLLIKAEQSIRDGNFYEGQQMYKTIYFREKDILNGDNGFLENVLFSGASMQLLHGHQNEGTELALLLIEAYSSNHIKPTKQQLETIEKIFSLYTISTEVENLALEDFMKAALKWTSTEGEYKEGDPFLHKLLSIYYSKSHNYGKAQKHYIRSNQPNDFAKLLIEWSKAVNYSELDLLIARPILQYLCLGNLKDANTIFEVYVNGIKNLPQTPLINFLRFLLMTVERDAYPLFNMLRTKYKPSLERDPTFQQYLNEIAVVFFKAQPTQTPSFNNMFGEIFKTMFASPAPKQ